MEAGLRMKRLQLRASIALILCLAGMLAPVSPVLAQSRQVSVGVYANEPKIVLGEDGQISGILGELLKEIARQEDWQLNAVPCDWQQCLERTQSGEIDLLPDVAFNETRALSLDFHQVPSLYSWSQLYSSERLQLASVLDLEGHRIAVLEGSIQQNYLRDLLKSFGLNAELIGVSNLLQGFEQVASGAADAVVANQQFGDFHAPHYRLYSTPIMFQPAQLFYATRKGQNAELLASIDKHLQHWQGSPDSYYYQILQRWGGERPTLLVPTAVWWGLGGLAVLLLLALGGAIILRRQVAEKTRHLLAGEQRLNTILDSVEAYIYIKDTQLRYQYANRKVCELFGQPLEQVIGKTDECFFDLDTATHLHENDRRVLQFGERVEEEEVNRGLNGATEHAFLSVKLPLRNAAGQIYALCGISTDITERKDIEEHTRHMAQYDGLTHLPNRALFSDRLQQALAAAKRDRNHLALMFLDLDKFKPINDTYGHAVGDLLLKEAAQRIQDCLRASDTAARIGGDEFVVLLPVIEAEQDAGIVGEKIRHALVQPFELAGHTLNISSSIGVAVYPEHGADEKLLVKSADIAMYHAKKNGRDNVKMYQTGMQEIL